MNRLTPKSQGYRMRRKSWPAGRYYDIRKVGRFWVNAINEKGEPVEFERDETERDWIVISGTTGADEA